MNCMTNSIDISTPMLTIANTGQTGQQSPLHEAERRTQTSPHKRLWKRWWTSLLWPKERLAHPLLEKYLSTQQLYEHAGDILTWNQPCSRSSPPQKVSSATFALPCRLLQTGRLDSTSYNRMSSFTLIGGTTTPIVREAEANFDPEAASPPDRTADPTVRSLVRSRNALFATRKDVGQPTIHPGIAIVQRGSTSRRTKTSKGQLLHPGMYRHIS
jgi:hypothetical protein